MNLAKLGLVLALAVPASAQEGTVVYQGARILPGGKPAIAQGVLIVSGGKVLAVGGPSTSIPSGATVVDCSGKTITPGLVDASFAGAMTDEDSNEQSEEVTPSLRAIDSLDLTTDAVRHARAAGVTTVHAMPGTKNVIGGIGCVVKTVDDAAGPHLLVDDASLRITMGAEPSMGNRAIRGGRPDSMYYRRPTTRMGVIWEVRKAFYDAKAKLERTAADGPGDNDPATDVLTKVLQGKLVAYTTARSEQDLRTALRLADEFGYKTVLDEAQDAYYLVDEIAAAKVAVLLGAPSAEDVTGRAGADGASPRFSTIALLAQKKVPFVVTTGTNAAALDLVREAMFAVRFGLSPEQAIDAVTIRPAQLLGIDNRVGSLAAGKDADFVVWSHDPLDPAAVAESVHIDGISVLESR
ncbi:MAG: amidohydrolase family protein [Planctomycetes bacterium]|nr:amidohydrolase family protein [Planctomycetota bacterium]